MVRHPRNSLLALLGLGAAGGLAAAGVSLYRALAAARMLVSAGTLGISAVSGIQYEAQASRQAVLQILVAENSDARRERSLEARRTDARIETRFQELVGLLPSRATQAEVAGLQDDWRSYMDQRESVMALALSGRLAEARVLEAGPSSVAFERAAIGMQGLQHTLGDFAAQQQEIVRRGLKDAVAELGALAAATILFVATLIWSRRKQRKLLSLQSRAEQLEQERGRILEMTGRNEPLLAILHALVSVTQKQLPGSVACVSVIQDGRLRDVIAPGLPKTFVETAYQHGAVVRRMDPSTYQNRALFQGPADCWSRDVLSSSGNKIGRVDVFVEKRAPVGEAQIALLEGVANLAGIVIQHREMYEQLAFQATRAPLTDFPNRRLFQDRLEQAILGAHRYKEKVAVILIDLDRFKQVNDLLGHRVGDALLREVAKRAEGCLRKSDTLSRMVGDEFTVLLSPVDSVEGAEQALRRIVQALQAPLTILEHKISISASIGLSVYPDHGEDPATLVRNADLAMYHAKGRGKNGWQTYVPELGAVLLQRMSIEKALESAVENGELELHYQAQTDLDRHLIGVEALLRWRNPDLGQVLPATFIPVAEESGLIVSIGAWVLEQACRQTASWIRSGFSVGHVAVNISARQLR